MVFSISWEKVGGWLQTADERLIGWALEKTDPDPYADQIPRNYFEELKKFSSLAQLVREEREVPNHPLWQLIAETYEGWVRQHPVEDLLQQLSRLEGQAFQYEPNAKELKIKDPESFLDLKNYLRAIERIAFENGRLLRKWDRPEVRRLAILLSPHLNSQDRGMIYQAEKGMINLDTFLDWLNLQELHLLQNYNGWGLFEQMPGLQRIRAPNDYLSWRWPEDEIVKSRKRFFQAYQKKVERVLSKVLSPQEIEELWRLDSETLLENYRQFLVKYSMADTPKERIDAQFSMQASLMPLFWQRGWTSTRLIEKLSKLAVSSHPLTARFPRHMIRVQKAFAKGPIVVSTEYRLDNYALRDRLLQAALAMFRDELTAEGSFLASHLANPHISTIAGYFMSMGKGFQIPLQIGDIFALAQSAKKKAGLLFPGEVRSWDQPITWEEIEKKGIVTLPLASYPRSSNPLEDELEMAKHISYQGVTLFDLLSYLVDSVTFTHTVWDEAKVDYRSGTSRPLFKNIELSYLDRRGRRFTARDRLGILAHEVFHNLEGLRFLKGILPEGANFRLLRERGAYLFQAFCMEEYLQWRLQQQNQKPLDPKERDAIIRHIAWIRARGFAANYWIAQFYPDWDITDARVEISPVIEHKILEQMGLKPKEDPRIGDIAVSKIELAFRTAFLELGIMALAKKEGMSKSEAAEFFLEMKEGIRTSDPTNPEVVKLLKGFIQAGLDTLILPEIERIRKRVLR